MSQDNLKQQTKKGLYWKFVEQFSNYGMQFIIGIFMARMLSPEDYGITALPGVFLAVSGIFIEAGFVGALIRKPNVTDSDLTTSFLYSLSAGILCYVLLFIAAPYIADFYNTPVLTPLIRVSTLSFIWGPLSTPQYILLNKKMDFKTIAKISVVSKIVMGICGVTMAYIGWGVWALTISNMVGGLVGLVLVCSIVKWFPKASWSKDSFHYLWGYGNKMMLSGLLERLYNNITPIFIGKYYSPYQLGVYNRAYNYASLPSMQVTGVLQTVTFPALSKIQENDNTLALVYRRLLKSSSFLIFPVMMLLSALARPLVIVMLTNKWESCVVLLQIMCFSFMWYPVHALNLNLLQVKGRTDLFLRLEVIKKIVGISFLAVTLPMGLVAFCVGGVLSSVFMLSINTYYTGKLIGVGYYRQMKDLIPSLCLSLLMWIVIHVVNYFVSSHILQIVLGSIAGLSFYTLLAYFLRCPELTDVKYMLKR